MTAVSNGATLTIVVKEKEKIQAKAFQALIVHCLVDSFTKVQFQIGRLA